MPYLMHPIHDDTQLAEAVCGAAVVHRFCTVVTVGAGPQVLGPGYDGVAHHRYEPPPGQRLTKAEIVKMVQEWGRDNLTEEGMKQGVEDSDVFVLFLTNSMLSRP